MSDVCTYNSSGSWVFSVCMLVWTCVLVISSFPSTVSIKSTHLTKYSPNIWKCFCPALSIKDALAGNLCWLLVSQVSQNAFHGRNKVRPLYKITAPLLCFVSSLNHQVCECKGYVFDVDKCRLSVLHAAAPPAQVFHLTLLDEISSEGWVTHPRPCSHLA